MVVLSRSPLAQCSPWRAWSPVALGATSTWSAAWEAELGPDGQASDADGPALASCPPVLAAQRIEGHTANGQR